MVYTVLLVENESQDWRDCSDVRQGFSFNASRGLRVSHYLISGEERVPQQWRKGSWGAAVFVGSLGA
jgi:hypothetical protein